jgi:transcriptional regulator GlxA family with amidase domain
MAGDRDDHHLMWSTMEFLIGEIQRLEGRVREVLLAFLRDSPLRAILYPDVAHFDGETQRPRPRIVSRRVRKVEQYLEAHWRDAITVRKLCASTGIPPRTLFQLFRAERGYSPMWFLKRVRLRHARQALSHPVAGTSVRQIARDCGFSNLGHFARDYYLAFGERPLTTLANAKSALV